jgi:hypothetical protein
MGATLVTACLLATLSVAILSTVASAQDAASQSKNERDRIVQQYKYPTNYGEE